MPRSELQLSVDFPQTKHHHCRENITQRRKKKKKNYPLNCLDLTEEILHPQILKNCNQEFQTAHGNQNKYHFTGINNYYYDKIKQNKVIVSRICLFDWQEKENQG